MRQVTVVLKGQHSIRKSTIGEGTLRSLPPGAPMVSRLRSQPLDVGLSTLDYEGEVRANSDITVGQFVLSRVQVRVRFSCLSTRGWLLIIEPLTGLHDDLPGTTEPIYVTAKSSSALAPDSYCHRLFYGFYRPRKSRLMILLCILPLPTHDCTVLYPPSIFFSFLFKSLCIPPAFHIHIIF